MLSLILLLSALKIQYSFIFVFSWSFFYQLKISKETAKKRRDCKIESLRSKEKEMCFIRQFQFWNQEQIKTWWVEK